MSVVIPSKRIIIGVRLAPSLWKSFEEAVANTDDPTVMLVQAQAKTYAGNGATSTSLFAQQQWDDHPGAPPSHDMKNRVHAALQDMSYTVDIVNTSIGEHASDRTVSGQLIIEHLADYYGVKNIRYNMPYDVDGRNDKFHETEYVDENGAVQKSVEDVIPSGIYMPRRYRKLGASALTVMDPHSVFHRDNLIEPFGKDNVAILSNVKQIADQIMIRYEHAIRNGNFRIGAPDGWDKKDDVTKNAATERVKDVARHIWEKMPEIHGDNGFNVGLFMDKTIFGITKVRRRAYEGAPAKPEITGFRGDVGNCDCVLMDDLVDSGGSLTKSAEVLIAHGAHRVGTAVCHGPATKEALQLLLGSMTEVNGETKVTLDHHIFTNTVTRLEEFHQALPPQDKRRVTMVNCGPTLLEEFAKPFPKPQTSPYMAPRVKKEMDLTPHI